MKQLLFSIGLLLSLALPASVDAASPSSSSSSAPTTIYTRLKQQVEKETSIHTFDDDVITFLRLASSENYKGWKLTDKQIRDVLNGNSPKACADAPEDNDLHNRVACEQMAEIIVKMAHQEQSIRVLGRRLTTIISSYEIPLSDVPEQSLSLSSDLLGILSIWSAGMGSIHSQVDTPIMRTIKMDDAILKPRLEAIASTLKTLGNEELIAAVWRYKYGVLLQTGQREPDFPRPMLPDTLNTGTERQYLSKEWNGLQNALLQLWDAVRTAPLTTPLAKNEIAYVHIPPSSILPDTILVWARIHSTENGIKTFGDVGLDWKLPLEPVFPSMKKDGKDEAILGGNFPPEPITEKNGNTEPLNGMQLCSHPFASRGYLCRPYKDANVGIHCPVEISTDADEISLTHCTVFGDKMKSSLQWCSTDKKVNGTCKPLNASSCKAVGGTECGTLEQCQKIWKCTPSPAASKPTWCCLKRYDNMCAITSSSTECIERGGSPSEDEAGCTVNGCKLPENPDIRFTSAGADVCREIDWKKKEDFDPQTQCTISLRCADECDNGPNVAYAFPKKSDGTIDICIEKKAEDISPISYVAFHELVHGYQFCGQPPSGGSYIIDPPNASETEKQKNHDENTERCCRMEGEAYRAQCAMMERDGVFTDENGNPKLSLDGIPMNAETCAEITTDRGCREVEVNGSKLTGCFLSKKYPEDFFDTVLSAMKTNPKNVPVTCEDAIDPKKMDPRVKALKEAAERRDDVCTPTTETEYGNRIGNNLCYIGQCVEQSVELHRLTAGRSPAGVQDAVSPFADPITGTPLGNLLTNPPLSQYRFPPYRPELLVRVLDTMLCQSAGLPPLMPPIRCAVEATRQLQQTRAIGFESAIGLVGQGNEQEIALRDLLELSSGIGTRTGTELYANYLRESSRSFAEILGMAAELLRQLNTISFPTEMCPIIPGLPSKT